MIEAAAASSSAAAPEAKRPRPEPDSNVLAELQLATDMLRRIEKHLASLAAS